MLWIISLSQPCPRPRSGFFTRFLSLRLSLPQSSSPDFIVHPKSTPKSFAAQISTAISSSLPLAVLHDTQKSQSSSPRDLTPTIRTLQPQLTNPALLLQRPPSPLLSIFPREKTPARRKPYLAAAFFAMLSKPHLGLSTVFEFGYGFRYNLGLVLEFC
ncbi:hypothetical protein Drorol1_Dr00013437 [Drosera rotundifolia]